MAEDGFRKVLIIAYYFPPMGLSGVQRTVKFAKYLSQYGWKPTVLTVNPAGYFAFDDTLLKEAEAAGVRIVRTNSRDVNRFFTKEVVIKLPSERTRKILQYIGDWFFIPDTKVGWKSLALKRATELLEQEQFDMIFATAPPQTGLLIGTVLKKRFKLPFVVELSIQIFSNAIASLLTSTVRKTRDESSGSRYGYESARERRIAATVSEHELPRCGNSLTRI
jgi:hypothetical protein